jgi:hypothetical protein
MRRSTVVLSLLLVVALSTAVPVDGAPDTSELRVLFIGNSYTYVNGLPELTKRLAASAPEPASMSVEMLAPGGATLERHWDDGAALDLIRRGGWTHVVLQEQSQRPFRDPELFFDYARRFAEAIREAGATPVLYLTWARQQRPETQEALTDAFVTLAEKIDVVVAPVGVAWKIAGDRKADSKLYYKDGSHPSPTGTYLAACVFYATLTDRSPVGLGRIRLSTRFGADNEGDPGEIDPLPRDAAERFQRIALDAVAGLRATAAPIPGS